jgi:chemotaxis protein methyltransferase CheR
MKHKAKQNINRSISHTLLLNLSEFVASQTGLHFSKERWCDLERGIYSAAREFGFKDTESCIQWLISSPLTKKQIEILSSHLTVGETYFFRNKKSLEVLEEYILPELIHLCRGTEKRLRIWSAGCATGEEPYSIAILISKLIPDWKDWNITILATDINTRFLQRALEGVYTEWSFRDTPTWVKERYFQRKKEGRFEILPEIKKMVTFSYHNLAEDTYPSLLNNTNAMDIIFCRNVLMYFGQERARKVIYNFYCALVNGGWLIVSPCEISHVLFSQFVTVNFLDTIFYRKDSKKIPVAEDFLPMDTLHALHEEVTIPLQPSHEFIPEVATDIAPSQPYEVAGAEEAEKVEPQQILFMEPLMLYKQGMYGEVVEKLMELFLNKQETPEAIALLVRAYANLGRLSEAFEWCEKAIAADKLDPALHYLRATILQEQGDINEAIKSLKRALYLDQKFVLVHFALGNLTHQQGKLKESEKYFANALSLLSMYQPEDILPESEGMTAGRLKEIIRSTIMEETFA